MDKESRELLVLASPLEADAHCKPVDVLDGYWRFFADDGSPLEAIFENPVATAQAAAGPGPFALQRAMSGRWLQELIEQVTAVQGSGFTSIADVAEVLQLNRAKRVARDARRR